MASSLLVPTNRSLFTSDLVFLTDLTRIFGQIWGQFVVAYQNTNPLPSLWPVHTVHAMKQTAAGTDSKKMSKQYTMDQKRWVVRRRLELQAKFDDLDKLLHK